jgi:hypothetical protein
MPEVGRQVLDDDDARAGMQMTAAGRVELMQRLARSKGVDMSSHAGVVPPPPQTPPVVLPMHMSALRLLRLFCCVVLFAWTYLLFLCCCRLARAAPHDGFVLWD